MTESGIRPTAPALRRGLPAVGAALSLLVIFVAALSIPLNAASQLDLSLGQTTGWIVALYGLSALATIGLVLRYRQPLLVTGNIFMLLFIASLGTQFAWAELVGAAILAGAIVLVIGSLGLTDRVAAWLPAPIVFGLLAAAVLPLFVDLFTELGEEPWLVGGMLAAYVFGRLALGPSVPAILPALAVGLVIAALTGGFEAPTQLRWPAPAFTTPEFSLQAIVTATPVIVVLITVQANVPSVAFLRTQGYRPPEPTLASMSGAGTIASSLLGPTGLSLSLPATALCAGPGAGERSIRHWSAYIAAAGSLVIAAFAGLAAELNEIVPSSLIVAAVGFAVVGVLSTALHEIARGPLRLGPMFALAVGLSDLSLLDLGSFFWALVLGLGVSALLERHEWELLRTGPTEEPNGSHMR